MQHWGDFQSVIQLSIALNAAYAALASYLGTNLPNERGLIQEIMDAIPKAQRATSDIKDTETQPTLSKFTTLQLLYGKSIEVERRYESIINAIVRPICILSAILGAALLIASSFFYSEEISTTWQVVSSLLILPFIAGAIYSLCVSIQVHLTISNPRRQCEKDHASK